MKSFKLIISIKLLRDLDQGKVNIYIFYLVVECGFFILFIYFS